MCSSGQAKPLTEARAAPASILAESGAWEGAQGSPASGGEGGHWGQAPCPWQGSSSGAKPHVTATTTVHGRKSPTPQQGAGLAGRSEGLRCSASCRQVHFSAGLCRLLAPSAKSPGPTQTAGCPLALPLSLECAGLLGDVAAWRLCLCLAGPAAAGRAPAAETKRGLELFFYFAEKFSCQTALKWLCALKQFVL